MPLPPSWILFNIVGYCLIWTVCDVRARRQQGYSIKREIAGAVPLPRSWILFNIVGYCLIWTVCDVRARRQQDYSIKREIMDAVPLRYFGDDDFSCVAGLSGNQSFTFLTYGIHHEIHLGGDRILE